MPKKYNTPKRKIVVKTRMTEEEYPELAAARSRVYLITNGCSGFGRV